MHPPANITNFHLFNFQESLKHSTQSGSVAVNIEECLKGNWIATTFVTNLGRPPSQGEWGMSGMEMQDLLTFKLSPCSFSSTLCICHELGCQSSWPNHLPRNDPMDLTESRASWKRRACVVDYKSLDRTWFNKLFPNISDSDDWPDPSMLTCTYLSFPSPAMNWELANRQIKAEPNYLCPDLTLCAWPSMDNSDNGDIWRDITFAVAPPF